MMSCGVSTLSALVRLAALTLLVASIAAASVAPGRAARFTSWAGSAEHRLHPHRRPLLESRAVHAARPADAARGNDVHELLPHRLALLPLARVDLQRPLPAQPRRAHQHASHRRVLGVPPRRG